MIEEQAEVTRIEGTEAWVSCRTRADCARCAEGRGCGGGLVGRWLGDRLHQVRVSHSGDLAVGQCVVIGMDERVLLQAAAVVYGIPLAGLFAGAILAQLWIGGEGAALLGAVAGLLAGFAWVQAFSRKIRGQRRFQPRVLRRAVLPE